jgi:TrmH family RNA methyltransferase
MTLITSFANQNVKLIRKLEQKKYRQESGLFFIEGLRTVGEAVQTGAPIETLVFAPELLISDFGKSLLKYPAVENIETLEVSSEIYQKIAHKEGPQGIGAIVKQDWKVIDQILADSGDLWVGLDSVSDPGNLGTIMRTAEAVGCRGIILLGHSTDPYDPTAVKASMGAVFSLELVQSDWDSFNNWKNNNQFTMVGTSDSAKTDYQMVAYRRPLILLMGSERHGLPDQMQSTCEHMVFIPMEGRTDSLNLAVATGIMLYEIYNQTRILESVES